MDRFNSPAIVLNRTNFGEADRIITFITPDHGKIKALAKGVRKSRSKLAGALEVFSVAQIMILPGKNDIDTLMSARLDRHYASIVKNIKRTESAYECMRLINKITQEKPEADYFHLLDKALAAINSEIELSITDLWFRAKLLKITGHMPNLSQDRSGRKLELAKNYNFDFDKMRFQAESGGSYSPNDIKFFRLIFSADRPAIINRVQSAKSQSKKLLPLTDNLMSAISAH